MTHTRKRRLLSGRGLFWLTYTVAVVSVIFYVTH